MNEQQEKLYQAILDQNELAKAAGEPCIKDPERAQSLFMRLATLTEDAAAADLCARISDGRFEEELAEEIRILTEARADFADGDVLEDDFTTGRLDYLYQCLYTACAGSRASNVNKSNMWQIISVSKWLATGSAPVLIGQHPATNLLAEFLKSDRQLRIGLVNKSTLGYMPDEIKYKNYSIRLQHPELNDVSITTLMLLDYLFWCYIDTGQLLTVTPLQRYAELRGKQLDTRNHITAFKAQVNKDLDALEAFGFKRLGKNKKADQMYVGFGANFHGILKDDNDKKSPGNIVWEWNTGFMALMNKNSKTMAFFPDFFKLDPRTNAYCFARYIALNVRRNEEKHPLFKIAIQTLLKVARFMPDYEVLKRNRISVKDRMITPFFRDMNAIPHIAYTAHTPDGRQFDQNDAVSDGDFLGGYILVDCSAFPVNNQRILKKNDHKEKMQTAKVNAIAANAAKQAAKAKKPRGRKKQNAM